MSAPSCGATVASQRPSEAPLRVVAHTGTQQAAPESVEEGLKPATTPIPVQLSEPEFDACILPHLSMPKRGPKCTLGSYRVFNLILRLLYTGLQGKGLPGPTDAQGNPAIPDTTVDKVFAKWADDGSLWPALVASVRHRAAEQHLDTSVLHGDGTNTVAKKGGMASGPRDTNIRRGSKASLSSTLRAMS